MEWELTLAERFLVDKAWRHSGYTGRDDLLEAVAQAQAKKLVEYLQKIGIFELGDMISVCDHCHAALRLNLARWQELRRQVGLE